MHQQISEVFQFIFVGHLAKEQQIHDFLEAKAIVAQDAADAILIDYR